MISEPSLNAQQLAAVRHGIGPMRIIAGAGTGKTQTLMHRFLFLVDSGVRKDRILCLTFSRKAAHELRRRVLRHLDAGHGSLTINTFHAFCRALLDQWNMTNQAASVRILTGPELMQFVLKVVGAIPDSDLIAHQGAFGRRKLVENLLTFGSQTRDQLMTPDDVDAYVRQAEPVAGRLHDLALAHRRVTEAMDAADVYDFAALGVEVVRRLREDEALLARTRARFDHILVDEFQDTNLAQFALIRLLAGEAGNICVVGDANQAIYAFRGGQARYITEFQEEFPGAATYSLGTNYRSGQTILDPANRLIEHNPGSDHVFLTADDPQRGGTVSVTRTANPALEAAHIARSILELTRRGEGAVGFADIAILLRSTERNSAPIEQALAANGIPFQSREENLGNAESIRDVLSGLRLVAGPPRWRDAARLISKGSREHAQALRSIESRFPDIDEQDALLDPSAEISSISINESDALREIRRIVALARQYGERDAPQALYHAMLLASVLSETTDPLTAATMKAFLGRANAVFDAGGSVAELAEQLTAEYDGVPWSAAAVANGVSILTVHAAKGLEWPVVFMPAMVDGEFPLPMKLDADFDSEILNDWRGKEGSVPSERDRRYRFLCEERRLAYVAMTRAQSELHVSYPAKDSAGAENRVSPFLAEAGLTDVQMVRGPGFDESPPASPAELARQLRTRRNAALIADMAAPELPDQLAGLLLDHYAAAAGIAGAIPHRAKRMPRPFGPSRPMRLSYSQISLYEGCPRQYFYARALGLEEPEESSYLTFGSAVHAALNALNLRWRETDRVPDRETIESMIDASWPARAFEFHVQARQFRGRASAILQRYYAWERERRPARRPEQIESSFVVGYDNHALTGRIDVVLVDDDQQVEIVDFKTSRPGSSSIGKPAESLQLFIYDFAHRARQPEANPTVSFYALRHEDDRAFNDVEAWDIRQVKSFRHSDESRQMLGARLDGLIDQLEANDFTPKPSYGTCGRCAFRWLCPEGSRV